MWIVNDGRYDDPDESCEEDELYAVCKGNHDDVRDGEELLKLAASLPDEDACSLCSDEGELQDGLPPELRQLAMTLSGSDDDEAKDDDYGEKEEERPDEEEEEEEVFTDGLPPELQQLAASLSDNDDDVEDAAQDRA